MEKMLPVTVYADITGQYTDDEIDLETCADLFGNTVEIPVPESLLKQWWYECLEFDREQACFVPEGGWPPVTDFDFYQWVYEESTADDTVSLIDWLSDHRYQWRRLH